MNRPDQIRRAAYAMVAVDVLLILILVLLSNVVPLIALAAVSFPALLISNFLFLRRKLKVADRSSGENFVAPCDHRFSVFICSAVFFVGALCGVLMVSQGELPMSTAPFLLVPLSLAVYCLRTGLRSRRKAN